MAVRRDGFCGTAGRAFFVGKVEDASRQQQAVTDECLAKALALIRPGIPVRDIGRAIPQYAAANGYAVSRPFSGSGIGRQLHGTPAVPNDDDGDATAVLAEGKCLVIFPLRAAGDRQVRIRPDGWTAETWAGRPVTQALCVVAVTREGSRVLR